MPRTFGMKHHATFSLNPAIRETN